MAPEPVPLWTTADIATRLGISQERARVLSNRPGFPVPSFQHGLRRFWLINDVEAWITENRPDKATQ